MGSKTRDPRHLDPGKRGNEGAQPNEAQAGHVLTGSPSMQLPVFDGSCPSMEPPDATQHVPAISHYLSVLLAPFLQTRSAESSDNIRRNDHVAAPKTTRPHCLGSHPPIATEGDDDLIYLRIFPCQPNRPIATSVVSHAVFEPNQTSSLSRANGFVHLSGNGVIFFRILSYQDSVAPPI
jgi:hypothetical protein